MNGQPNTIKTKEENRETLWICPACGRTAEKPTQFTDVSCVLNSLLCYTDKLQYENNRLRFVQDGGVVEPQPEKFPDIN